MRQKSNWNGNKTKQHQPTQLALQLAIWNFRQPINAFFSQYQKSKFLVSKILNKRPGVQMEYVNYSDLTAQQTRGRTLVHIRNHSPHWRDWNSYIVAVGIWSLVICTNSTAPQISELRPYRYPTSFFFSSIRVDSKTPN